MEYCLSLLYVAMDELGLIWCMDAFMELDTKVAQEIQDYVRVMNTYSAARVKRQ